MEKRKTLLQLLKYVAEKPWLPIAAALAIGVLAHPWPLRDFGQV